MKTKRITSGLLVSLVMNACPRSEARRRSVDGWKG